MKRFLFLIASFFLSIEVLAQNHKTDSLLAILKTAKEDSNKLNLLSALMLESETIELYKYAKPLLILSNKLLSQNNKKSERKLYLYHKGNALNNIGYHFQDIGEIDSALHYYNLALGIFQELKNFKQIAMVYLNLGTISQLKGNMNEALLYFKNALNIQKKIADYEGMTTSLNNLGNIQYSIGNLKGGMIYHKEALELREIQKDSVGLTYTLINLGGGYFMIGNYDSALVYYQKCLEIQSLLKERKSMVTLYNNIGIIHKERGDLPQALDYFFKSIKLSEEINFKVETSTALNNIATVYELLDEEVIGLKYHINSLKLREELNDKNGIASSLSNIGMNYFRQKKLNEAISFMSKSLKIATEINLKNLLATVQNNLGCVYLDKNDIENAENYLNKSLAISVEIDNKKGISQTKNNLSKIFFKHKNYPQALNYSNESLKLAKDLGNIELISNAAGQKVLVLEALGRYKEALDNHRLQMEMRDSLTNQKNRKELVRKQFQYEYDKSIALIKLEQEKKNIIANKEIEKQKMVRNSFIGGFILVLIIAFGIFRSLQQNRRAKKIINRQKEMVEEKNKEILDSISYARRLQNAILPTNKLVKEYLVDSFIFYEPKDIVAGDFYWFYPDKNSKGETIILFAAADCTGHGVPGAMVSVVCANALNKAVKEQKLRDPGRILDAVNDYVTETFLRSESTLEDGVQDGMDISLCVLNLNTLQLLWSGANNPLIVVKKTSNEQTNLENYALDEIKPNKQPIGPYLYRIAFTTHSIQLEKGEMLYLFSDGYADQFGGLGGKKLLKKNLKDLLLKLAYLPTDIQLKELTNHFITWKGKNSQVDDVCIIGVRV